VAVADVFLPDVRLPAALISLASAGLSSSLKGFIGEPLMTARELSAELMTGDAA